MLTWMLVGGLTGLACAFAAWLDRRALKAGLEEMRQELPGRCPYCALREHYSVFHDEPAPGMPRRHRCTELRSDLVPAGGHEVASANEQTAETVGAIVTEMEREGLPG